MKTVVMRYSLQLRHGALVELMGKKKANAFVSIVPFIALHH